MTALAPYLHLPGTARAALARYAQVFGGTLVFNTFRDFHRTDGPGEAIAHGMLQGPVTLFASDAGEGEATLHTEGVMFCLLGTADAATLRGWFDGLSEGGRIIEDLQQRPWGAWDGQVVDRFGMHWLIGFEPE